ncbi:hypothetical protein JYU34_007318 [Plutella xylostella]|uniref:Sugar transporter SWEET n=2 Tax=Plutella xylostella TaxID=51655 RepID=A0A8S4DHC2_PLUXY|nr:sugar transporter SWEET1 [Plutella xylostella]KAG7307167.1 hypothetical protein JYU34_007318 [Plutella xylostella]CAG9096419.1 unnamed protein product [Plutella xylostella]
MRKEEDTLNLIVYVAIGATFVQFLSGTLVCKQYVVNRSTGDASPLPFISAIASCAVWLLYGFVKSDANLICINIIGITLMVIYTVVFYLYAQKKRSVIKQAVLLLIFLMTVTEYTIVDTNYFRVKDNLGILACVLTLFTIGAPLSKLLHVIHVQNTECLPFPMILMSFIVCTMWYMYGKLIDDMFIQLPNFLGGLIAAFQLLLFVVYPSKASASASSTSLI